jgi:hypothetical protein
MEQEGGKDYIRDMEETGKKNVNVVTVDPSKIVDGDGNPIDLKRTGALRRWLINRYDGREVVIADNGRTVRFTQTGIQASLKRRKDEQRQAYAALDRLLENGVYQGDEAGDAKHNHIERQDIYYAAAQIGDKIYGVRFKVDVRKDGGHGEYKDHKVIRIDGVEEVNTKKPPSPYAGVSPAGTEGGVTIPVSKIQAAMGLTSNITDSAPKSKEKNKKVSDDDPPDTPGGDTPKPHTQPPPDRTGGTGKYKALVTKIKNAAETLTEFIENDPDAVNLTKKDEKRILDETKKLLKRGDTYIDEMIMAETDYAPEDIMAVWNSVDTAKIDAVLLDYVKGLDTAQKKAIVLAAVKGKVLDTVPKKKTLTPTGNKIAVEKEVSPEELAVAYRAAILEEAEKRRLTEIKTVYDELWALSQAWRPLNGERAGDKKYMAYRQSGEEVFANAVSVFLSEPGKLKREAPNFWRVFHGWEGSRNPFTEVYEAIQGLYAGGDEAVMERRSEERREGYR